MTQNCIDANRKWCVWRAKLSDSSGQSLIEGALVIPLLLAVAMGVVELGLALHHQHAVTSLSREGANLTSRSTSLQDAAAAVTAMSRGSIDFATNSRVIFSVLKRGATPNTPNFDRLVLYQRYEYGTYAASSRLTTRGVGSFGGPPDYVAVDSDNDAALQVTNAPAGIVSVRGGMVYVTEVFSSHTLITPLDHFGVQVPRQLTSIAYF